MPFTPPYLTYFTRGDLIYGLAHQRGGLRFHFHVQSTHHHNGQDAMAVPATVDEFRRGMLGNHDNTHKRDWKLFLRSNETHLRYGRYMRAIRAYNEDEEHFYEANEDHEALTNSAWRAKSKYGLEWVIRNHRGHIHFVLNDIDMGAVVTKTHEYRNPGNNAIVTRDYPRGKPDAEERDQKTRTITNSELRWVYRHRRIADVQQRVQFWWGSGVPNGLIGFTTWTPVGPPWDDAVRQGTLPSGTQRTWQRLWRMYQPLRQPLQF